MSTELTYLSYAALLTACLWIPYIVIQGKENGLLGADNYKDPTPRPVGLAGQRANRAHLNSVETLSAFAALILVVEVSGSNSEMTALWAAVFFWSRLAHAVVYLAGVPYLRTPVFTAGFVATVGLFAAVVG